MRSKASELQHAEISSFRQPLTVVLSFFFSLSLSILIVRHLVFVFVFVLVIFFFFFLFVSERTLHLHLFLHARAILSSSVRLNQIGPYNAQSLLLHTAPPIIDAELQVYAQAPYEGDVTISTRQPLTAEEEEMEEDYEGNKGGPRAVWPLGEILQGRHDFMHSRLFNT